jgi:hypothetical protein
MPEVTEGHIQSSLGAAALLLQRRSVGHWALHARVEGFCKNQEIKKIKRQSK